MAADPLVTLGSLDEYQTGDPQALLEQVTAEVRGRCGWHVAPPVTDTVTVEGDWSVFLPLPSLHVTDVQAVTAGGVLLDPGDYTWSQVGFLRRIRPWRRGWAGPVTVRFVHGYLAADDLAGVVKARVTRLQANPAGALRTTVGPFTDQFEGGYTSDELGVIRRYRLPAAP